MHDSIPAHEHGAMYMFLFALHVRYTEYMCQERKKVKRVQSPGKHPNKQKKFNPSHETLHA